jgi:hypothetical protein
MSSEECRRTEQFGRRLHVSEDSLTASRTIAAPIRREERAIKRGIVVSYGAADNVPDIRHGITLIHVLRNSPTRLSTATGTSGVELGGRVKSEGWAAPGKQYLASVDRTPRTPRLRHECCQSQPRDCATNPVSPDVA